MVHYSVMAQNVNPAASSSAGYDKDSMERKSATSSTQVGLFHLYWGKILMNILNLLIEELHNNLQKYLR